MIPLIVAKYVGKHVAKKRLETSPSIKLITGIGAIMVALLVMTFASASAEAPALVVVSMAGDVPVLQSQAVTHYVQLEAAAEKLNTQATSTGEFTEQEIHWMTAVLCYECAGTGFKYSEGHEGAVDADTFAKELTAMVIINRARSTFSTFAGTTTVEEVIKGPGYGYGNLSEDCTGSLVMGLLPGGTYEDLLNSKPEVVAVCEAAVRKAAAGEVVDSEGEPVPSNVFFEHSFPYYDRAANGAKVSAYTLEVYCGFNTPSGKFWFCSVPEIGRASCRERV